ncbi:hypothetical protein PMAC_000210 [Pneumocystis sp. 'macacae']|nr:hypothetical protein PMAC_000210 [Pneumocystis sp. 'macacae']
MPPACISHPDMPIKDVTAIQVKDYKYNSKGDLKLETKQIIGVEGIQETYKLMQVHIEEMGSANRREEINLADTYISVAKDNAYTSKEDSCSDETGECNSKDIYTNKGNKYGTRETEYMAENAAYMAEITPYTNKNSAYIETYVAVSSEQVVTTPLETQTIEWNSRSASKQELQLMQNQHSEEQQLMLPMQENLAQTVLSPSLPISPVYSSTYLSASALSTFYERTEHLSEYSSAGSSYLRKISSNPSFPSINILDNERDAGKSLKEATGSRIVRKKSGELVKSSLKTERKGRSQSMPSTPILHKNVQFATELEQIRHFSQAEKPTAISAEISTEEKDNYDVEFEHDFYKGVQEGFFETRWNEKKAYELEIELANFSEKRTICLSQNVHLESVYLSSNKRNLLGKIAVKNLAFEKSVGVRFTTDHWQTISEVNAEYTNDVFRKQYDGFDRFVFNIKLYELANIEDKTLYLCIRYRILGAEFWDNNSGMNYQIEFRKKLKTRTQPYLTRYPALFSTNGNIQNNIDSDLDTHLAECQLYKTNSFCLPIENNNLITTSPHLSRKKQCSNNLFSTRYDFSTSLTAAIKASNNIVDYDNKNANLETRHTNFFDISTKNVYLYSDLFLIEKISSANHQCNISFENNLLDTPSLDNLKSNTYEENKSITNLFKGNFKPSVDSVSYKNFLNNYCFFRGPDKINIRNANSKIHINERLVYNFSSFHRKSVLPNPLSSSEPISFSSFSSDTSLFYPHTLLPSISSDFVSSNMSKPSLESKTSIDLYYNHLINSLLALEAPGSTLTAIWT